VALVGNHRCEWLEPAALTHPQTVLVLGATGLAGRAIVARLAGHTPYRIRAAARSVDKLRAIHSALGELIDAVAFDANDLSTLPALTADAAFVINAIGPFARHGAAIAEAALRTGTPYLDCANEQVHYRALQRLDVLAREQQLPLITAAGAIPGISTLLVRDVLAQTTEPESAAVYWAQLRHAYADSGLGSVMGGILDATGAPEAWHDARPQQVYLGQSACTRALPPPFGPRRLLEVPTIDDLVLPRAAGLQTFHSWFYLGDLPTWLLGIIRLLQPQRRPWAYRLIERAMARINAAETAHAIAAGLGPEALLQVEVTTHAGEKRNAELRFVDGAAATALLPVLLAQRHIDGPGLPPGLHTPMDLVTLADAQHVAGDVLLGRRD